MADDLVHDPWYQYRNVIGLPSRKYVICGVIWIFLILMLVTVAFTIMSKQCCPETIKQDSFMHIQSSLNLSVNPCENFYNFSCGLWAQNNVEQSYELRITSFSILQKAIDEKKKSVFRNSFVTDELPHVVNEALRFYNICTSTSTSDANDISILMEYFDEIGGWPLLMGDVWDENSFDWFKASAFLVVKLDLHTIISFNTIDSEKSNGRNVIFLKPPTTLQGNELLSYSLGMLYSITNVLNTSYTHSEVMDHINKLGETEQRWRKELNYSPEPEPLSMTVEELINRIPEFDWLNYFQLIVNGTLNEINETVTLMDNVVINNFGYFQKLVSVLRSNSFSKRELANLFGWFIVKDIWILIPGVSEYYAKLYDFDSDDVKATTENQCYDLILDTFRCSIDYLFIKNSSHSGIQKSKILVNYLKSSLKDTVLSSSWLDQISKESVIQKLKHMKDIIGFPYYLNNKIEFNKIYENFPSVSTNSLKSYFLIIQYYFKEMLMNLKIPVDPRSWILPRSVTDVSAYYTVHKNILVFPISLHNHPFFYLYGPWYLNFGAIGSVIGHEIMHGFDYTHVQENAFLLPKTVFSNISNNFYIERTKCFKDQYNVYDATGMLKNNGSRTLRENIADSEGLHIAFKAYKKHEKDYGPEKQYQSLKNYSSEQMFFIAYGSIWCSVIKPDSMQTILARDTHSFPEIRVNRAVSNSEFFALAFNCPKGSPMNPVKKCTIW